MQSDLGQLGKEQVSSFIQLGSLSPKGAQVCTSCHTETSGQDLAELQGAITPEALRLQQVPGGLGLRAQGRGGGMSEGQAGPQPVGPQMPYNIHLSR